MIEVVRHSVSYLNCRIAERKVQMAVRVITMLLLAGTMCALGGEPGIASHGSGASGNWNQIGFAYSNENYAPFRQIDVANVGRLGLAWFLDLPGEQSLEATPLEVGGVLYFTGSHSVVYAVDAQSERVRWKYDPQVYRHSPQRMRYLFAANRGVGYAYGKVIVGTFDGRLIALDSRSGKPVWSVETMTPTCRCFITGAPVVFDHEVVIGNGGGDMGSRGYVTAYDVGTGKELWRFYTVPGSPVEDEGNPLMQKAAATWGGEYWKVGTGGSVWNAMTFDRQLNRIYIGTGNGAPFNEQVRSPGGGDNLFIASIVALDARSGRYIWHYQETPRDSWDFDADEQITLADLVIDGKPREVLMQASKNGFFYVIDRLTGKLISAEQYGKVTWAKRIDLKTGRPVEAPEVHYEKPVTEIWPSPVGAHSWQAMSFSPQTGLVYVPYSQVGSRFTRGPLTKDGAVFGAHLVMSPILSPTLPNGERGNGALIAWDPVAQRASWLRPYSGFWNGGTLATAGGLVFQGTGDGHLLAYSATSGKTLWTFDTHLGVIAAPMSYMVGRRQFVAILVGYGGTIASLSGALNTGWQFGEQPRRLLVFSLDGTAKLPGDNPRDFRVHALDEPSMTLSAPIVRQGATIYAEHCAFCHGVGLSPGGFPAPDLRESPVPLQRETFRLVVNEGQLSSAGMPRFGEFSNLELLALREYIRAGARAVIGKSRAPANCDKSAPCNGTLPRGSDRRAAWH